MRLGASTGGPQAITQVLRALPADFPAPIVVVLHLPWGFTQGYAERLNELCALRVAEAKEGTRLEPGRAVVAPGGSHLRVQRDGAGNLFTVLSELPRSLHRPSLDELFQSAATVTAQRTLAVVLTGMGDDGLAGSRALHARGADVLVQSERTCVVYGMPRVVQEAGLARAQHDLADLPGAILKLV
jgi:two-component system chemotaxis response regulator CheB